MALGSRRGGIAKTSRSGRSALESIQKNGKRNTAAVSAMPRWRAALAMRATVPRRCASDVIVNPTSLQAELECGQCHDHGKQHPRDCRGIAQAIGDEALAIDGVTER